MILLTCTALAARVGRARVGRRWLTRTADCGTQRAASRPTTAQLNVAGRLTALNAAARRAGAVVHAQAPVRALAGGRLNRRPSGRASREAARPGRGSSRPRPAAARSRCASSRVERQHGVRRAPENLGGSAAAAGLLLPPHDERLMGSHVEDRDHGAAAQRVAPAYLGDAINASPPRPDAEDPA
jgi:hypothetical protein